MTNTSIGATRYPYLLDENISPEFKTMLLQADIERDKEIRQSERESKADGLEKLKFWHNTPLVVALVGVITIGANFGSSYFLSDQTGDIGIEQRKREFSYGVLQSELSKTEDTDDRAKVLLFLAKAGVLDGLNVAELERLAVSAEAIPTTIGQGIPSYNEPLPTADPNQTAAANRLHSLAVEELNRNIEENVSVDRVMAYWSVLPPDQAMKPSATTPWGGVFISWLVQQAGNPDGMAMSPDVAGTWNSAKSKGLPAPEDAPLPGDIAIYGRDENTARAIREGGYGSGFACVVHSATDGAVTCIMGNYNDGVRYSTQLRDDKRLVGYVRIGMRTP